MRDIDLNRAEPDSPNTRLAEINRRNREFWDSQAHAIERLISSTSLPATGVGDYALPAAAKGTMSEGRTEPQRPDAVADLAAHPITVELKRRGARDDQLASVRFSSSNDGLSFDLWSFRAEVDEVSSDAIPLLKAYCALKWLMLDDPPSSPDRDQAWQLVAEVIAAPVFKIGLRTKASQRARAKKPRGRIENGITIRDLVSALVRSPEAQDATAKELWSPFFAALDARCLAPRQLYAPSDRIRAAYEYEGWHGRRQITFGRFASLVSKLRAGKSR